MTRILRLVSALLMAVYLGDLFMKRFLGDGFYAAYALPETAAYLALFFAVGVFLLSIIKLDLDDTV